jgi:hypothetical protein
VSLTWRPLRTQSHGAFLIRAGFFGVVGLYAHLSSTKKFVAPRALLRGILFIKRRFTGLRLRDFFSKTSEQTSKTRPRPWYQDRLLQFCRNNKNI